jgi:hypothetical protein
MEHFQFRSNCSFRGMVFVHIALLTLGFFVYPDSLSCQDLLGGRRYLVSRIGSSRMGQSSPDNVGLLLKITTEIVSQSYCKDSAKTFAVIFSLRVRILNRSDKKLILERTTGLYGIVVAHDEKSLSERKYEYSPSLSITMEPVATETPERFKSPGPEFAILEPGESLQTDALVRAPFAGRQPGSDQTSGTIAPGNHVLQVRFLTWDFQTEPKKIRRSWEPLGYLVYDEISTGPLPFSLPSDPKLEACK